MKKYISAAILFAAILIGLIFTKNLVFAGILSDILSGNPKTFDSEYVTDDESASLNDPAEYEIVDNVVRLTEMEAFTDDQSVTFYIDGMYATTDNYNTVHTNAFTQGWRSGKGIEYYIGNSQYEELTATLFVTKGAREDVLDEASPVWDSAYVKIYADDAVIFSRIGGFNNKMIPEDISVKIPAGTQFLRIEISGEYTDSNLMHESVLGLGEVYLR